MYVTYVWKETSNPSSLLVVVRHLCLERNQQPLKLISGCTPLMSGKKPALPQAYQWLYTTYVWKETSNPSSLLVAVCHLCLERNQQPLKLISGCTPLMSGTKPATPQAYQCLYATYVWKETSNPSSLLVVVRHLCLERNQQSLKLISGCTPLMSGKKPATPQAYQWLYTTYVWNETSNPSSLLVVVHDLCLERNQQPLKLISVCTPLMSGMKPATPQAYQWLYTTYVWNETSNPSSLLVVVHHLCLERNQQPLKLISGCTPLMSGKKPATPQAYQWLYATYVWKETSNPSSLLVVVHHLCLERNQQPLKLIIGCTPLMSGTKPATPQAYQWLYTTYVWNETSNPSSLLVAVCHLCLE